MPPSKRQGALQRISLVGILTGALAAELALHRVVDRLLHNDLLAPTSVLQLVDGGARLVYFFSGILAVMASAVGLGLFTLRSSLVPRGARGPTAAPALVFSLLALVGACFEMQGVLAVYLQGSYTALATLIVLAACLARIERRHKLGLATLLLPLVLRFTAIFLEAGHSGSGLAQKFLESGQIASVACSGALLACFLVVPRGWRAWLAVTLPTLLGIATAFLAIHLDWGIAARVALYGLGIELPLVQAGFVIYVLALGVWIFVTTSLLVAGGAQRLRGYGLALIGLAGYQLHQAGLLSASLTGFLCLALASEYELRASLHRDAWHMTIERFGSSLGALEVRHLGTTGSEDTRLRLERRGVPVELRLAHRSGELPQLEVRCGAAPVEQAAPLSLTRRGTDRLGKSDGPIVEIGDLQFDEHFRVRDARVLNGADPVLTDATRRTLLDLCEGWLGVWPGQGVCYRVRQSQLCAQLVAGQGEAIPRLDATLELLIELAR